jgi:phospholipid-binding lipoprotein MlaA
MSKLKIAVRPPTLILEQKRVRTMIPLPPHPCHRPRVGSLLVLMASSVLFAGCAEAPPAGDQEALAEYTRANDPMEPMNRSIYGFNTMIDTAVLRPSAERYRDYVPEFVQNRVRDFLGNLRAPIIFTNDVFQADSTKAMETLARFTVNTSFGAGGLFDVVSMVMPRHENDLGKTFGVWGVGEGPYLVLPLLGPSNPRDALGFAVEAYADPFDRYVGNIGYGEAVYPRAILGGIGRRADNIDSLDEIERVSIDPYSTIRSLYRQYRESLISGKPTADKPRPGLTGEFPRTGEFQSVELSQENN